MCLGSCGDTGRWNAPYATLRWTYAKLDKLWGGHNQNYITMSHSAGAKGSNIIPHNVYKHVLATGVFCVQPAYLIMGFRTIPLNIEPLPMPCTGIFSRLVAGKSVEARFNRRILVSSTFVQYNTSSSQSTAKSPLCVCIHVGVHNISSHITTFLAKDSWPYNKATAILCELIAKKLTSSSIRGNDLNALLRTIDICSLDMSSVRYPVDLLRPA